MFRKCRIPVSFFNQSQLEKKAVKIKIQIIVIMFESFSFNHYNKSGINIVAGQQRYFSAVAIFKVKQGAP